MDKFLRRAKSIAIPNILRHDEQKSVDGEPLLFSVGSPPARTTFQLSTITIKNSFRYLIVCLVTSLVWWAVLRLSPTQYMPKSTTTMYLHCGETASEARELGCQFDPLAVMWVPGPCFDNETLQEYYDYQEEMAWLGYDDMDYEQRIDFQTMSERVAGSDLPPYYTTRREHTIHCGFMLQRLHKGYLTDPNTLDEELLSFHHTRHCVKFLLDSMSKPKWELDSLTTKNKPGFSSCVIESGCSFDILVNNENFNQRSAERMGALQRLQRALGHKVGPHFWAACHTCDVNVLKGLADIASSDGHASIAISATSSTSYVLVKGWTPPTPSTATVSPLNGDDISLPKRLTHKERAIYRDNGRCILTGARVFDVAHIYPSALLATHEWKRHFLMLKVFWPPEKIAAWTAVVEMNKSDVYGERPFNMFCLNPLAHALWGQVEHRRDTDDIDLLTVPPSTRDLDSAYGCWLTHKDERMKSGHIVIMATNDPEAFPLTSFELEIQWFCRRILGMCGPAREMEWPSETEDDEEDEED
ncbi:hypothetical protein F5884DRAFT_893110 [Xylogone sp. PMI_703]|nr:hypothetical protein F5884DRAFT_893110 [Xylogone sp. PMI_703]